MIKVNIKGVIVSNDDKWIYDLFDVESTSPNDVYDQMENANNEDIEAIINSPGGDVFAGSEIYTSLKDYDGKVTTKIVGIAASMGSVIAMAGDKVLMSPTGQIMIHNVWSMAIGDYREMQHESDVLKTINKSISNAYRIKSDMEEKDILSLMDDETWLNSSDALEKGFIDEVMFENGQQFAAGFGNATMIPLEVINKIRNMKDVFYPTNSNENKSDFLMAKLNLLKLKGEMKDEF